MQDLDEKLRNELDLLFRMARQKFSSGDGNGAIMLAETAWSKLPEPKFGWDVSKSYTHALAKLYRDAKLYELAINLMNSLFASGTVKPYQDGPVFLMGTILFEKGDLDSAYHFFDEAKRISKGRCFVGEDKKYADFHRQRLHAKK